MSTVTLTIGPKSYAIAVADGQEAHITQLGAMIADKYAQLGSARAPLEASQAVTDRMAARAGLSFMTISPGRSCRVGSREVIVSVNFVTGYPRSRGGAATRPPSPGPGKVTPQATRRRRATQPTAVRPARNRA